MASKNATADSKPLSPWIRFGVPIGIFLVIIFFWAITPKLAFLFFRFYSVEELSGTPTFQDLGVVGDSFGLINALFAGGALVGVIVAIFLQNKELKLMHVEMRGQKEQLEAQRYALEQSNLDDTFFQMLRLRADIILGLARPGRSGSHDRNGYQFFNDQWSTLEGETSAWVSKTEDNKIKDLKGLYLNYWQGAQRDLAHYYRNLEAILQLIDECDYVPCLRYMRILAGQLSLGEEKLLFYHAAAGDGIRGRVFCDLVATAGLVDDLERDSLLDKSHHGELKRVQERSVLNPDNQKASRDFRFEKMDAKFQEEMRRENPLA